MEISELHLLRVTQSGCLDAHPDHGSRGPAPRLRFGGAGGGAALLRDLHVLVPRKPLHGITVRVAVGAEHLAANGFAHRALSVANRRTTTI